MVGFRGRFGAKQYMPNKPVKYGIKAFTMADSKNGYVLNVLPYTGRDTLQEASTEYVDLPQPARIVLHLIELYLNKSHHVFTDRYYTSIPLAQALTGRCTSFTGPWKRRLISTGDPERLIGSSASPRSVLSAVILQKARDTEVSTIVPLVHLIPHHVLMIVSNAITHKNHTEFIIFSCLFYLYF